MTHNILISVVLAAASASVMAQTAPVTAANAWARASVQGQRATGAYLTLTAREPLSLVGASSPAAGVAEVHEMKMDGDIMRMRPVPELALPAGKPVELKPGGLHVMLQELKSPLADKSQVPLTLTFRDAQGRRSELQLQVPVGTQAPSGGSPPAGHGHGHGHGHKH